MRALVPLLTSSFLAIGNVAALLSVIPLRADAGGAASGWVGATTGVMMGATVLTQLSMVWLLRVLTLRRMLALGAAVLGLATPVYVLSDAIALVLAVSVVRGAGFALVVVSGVALAAELAPMGKVATATGYYGAAAGLPNVLALPAGVWLAQSWGFVPVFLLAAGTALAAVPLALLLPEAESRRDGPRQRLGRLDRRVWTAVLVFLTVSATLGTVLTFLPVTLPGSPIPSLALLLLSLAMVLARVLAGRVADRYGPGRVLLPMVLLGAVGAAGLALAVGEGGWPLLLAAVTLGVGIGAVQNDSFVVVLERMGPGRSGEASTLWNIAYDGGMGVGPVLVGVGLAVTGYGGAFAALAVLLAVAGVAGGIALRGPGRTPPPSA